MPVFNGMIRLSKTAETTMPNVTGNTVYECFVKCFGKATFIDCVSVICVFRINMCETKYHNHGGLMAEYSPSDLKV